MNNSELSFWASFELLLKNIDDIVWGIPLIILILSVGIYLTARLGFLQILKLPKALKFMVKNEEGGKGEVSSFGALCTALSATIGTGNIVGVATAIGTGGPGALFWMWIAALFGMATKYAEGLLAIKYRVVADDGHSLGGPFYYIENGMGKGWKWLAKAFAFFCLCAGLLGIGTFTQINGITSAVHDFFDPTNAYVINIFGSDYSISIVIAGLILTICAAMVIVGGIKRIANISQVVIPFMAIAYFVCCVIILCRNYENILAAFSEIFESAFGIRAVTGGAIGTILISMQKGIARGIFSNEAGLGSAPIAAAAAKTNSPVRQGLVSMTGTFVDTIVICTLTGLCIVVTGAHNISGIEGVAVTTAAFREGLPFIGDLSAGILMACLVFFAFTTILGWSYYSERCLEYLANGKRNILMCYRCLYIFAIFMGPFMTVSAVWTIADIFNALMAIPNLIAIIFLSGVVVSETKKYFSKDK